MARTSSLIGGRFLREAVETIFSSSSSLMRVLKKVVMISLLRWPVFSLVSARKEMIAVGVSRVVLIPSSPEVMVFLASSWFSTKARIAEFWSSS